MYCDPSMILKNPSKACEQLLSLPVNQRGLTREHRKLVEETGMSASTNARKKSTILDFVGGVTVRDAATTQLDKYNKLKVKFTDPKSVILVSALCV